MREAYRLNNKALKLCIEQEKLELKLVFIYMGNEVESFQKIEEKIKVILKRLTENSEVVSE